MSQAFSFSQKSQTDLAAIPTIPSLFVLRTKTLVFSWSLSLPILVLLNSTTWLLNPPLNGNNAFKSLRASLQPLLTAFAWLPVTKPTVAYDQAIHLVSELRASANYPSFFKLKKKLRFFFSSFTQKQ
jgi:hypothetical protein